jgi:hypothetical protein
MAWPYYVQSILVIIDPLGPALRGRLFGHSPRWGEKICCAIGISSPSRGGATKWWWGFTPKTELY